MSKFQRKLAEKMGEKTMTISVKDWDELEELKEDYKSIAISDFQIIKRQETQLLTLKDSIKEYLESDYWANMNKENISKFNKIQKKLNDLIK